MAINLLTKKNCPDRVTHDLESVFYVLLFICTHLKGPLGEIQDPPLYGDKTNLKGEHPSPMKFWFGPNRTLEEIGLQKYCQMMSVFLKDDEPNLLKNISPYFYPLKKYLVDIRNALFTEDGPIPSASPCDLIEVFKAALQDEDLIKAAKKDYDLKLHHKRSLPGELVISPNSWDAAKPEESRISKKPKLAQTVTPSPSVVNKGLKKTKRS
jgi:hypothetical protein